MNEEDREVKCFNAIKRGESPNFVHSVTTMKLTQYDSYCEKKNIPLVP